MLTLFVFKKRTQKSVLPTIRLCYSKQQKIRFIDLISNAQSYVRKPLLNSFEARSEHRSLTLNVVKIIRNQQTSLADKSLFHKFDFAFHKISHWLTFQTFVLPAPRRLSPCLKQRINVSENINLSPCNQCYTLRIQKALEAIFGIHHINLLVFGNVLLNIDFFYQSL